jgi:hypothetical protein
VAIYLLEAEGVATFVTEHWQAAPDGSLPGLASVKKRLERTVSETIMSLTGATRTVQTRLLNQEAPLDASLVSRAVEILGELGAACEFVLDDDVHEPADDALIAAKARQAEDSTRATLIQSLHDFSTIASGIKDRLADLEDFEPALIDEAQALAAKLGASGAPQPGRPANPDVDLRNRLLTLLDRQVSSVRLASAWVFRNHPQVIRQVSSAYQRRRRMAARQRSREPPAPQP